jgi:hypothetical protein
LVFSDGPEGFIIGVMGWNLFEEIERASLDYGI